MAALDGVVTQLEEKASEIDRRHTTRALAQHRREKKRRTDGGEASTSRRLDRVEAWVARMEHQREEATPRGLAGTPSLPAPEVSATPLNLDFGGLPEKQYLDTNFPDLADLPCRLIVGIMEYLTCAKLDAMYDEPSGRPSVWLEHIKGAIEVIVEEGQMQIPARDTQGFRIVASSLAVRSYDEVPPLDPLKISNIARRVGYSADDSLNRVLNVTCGILIKLVHVVEIVPPTYRLIIEELADRRCLNDDDGNWNVDMRALAPKLVQIIRRVNGYNVCNFLEAGETKRYVRDRLDGKAIGVAIEEAKVRQHQGKDRQKKRARRGR